MAAATPDLMPLTGDSRQGPAHLVVLRATLLCARSTTLLSLHERMYAPGCDAGASALCAISKRYPTRPARVLLRERFARG
jgi:hypothetical protein